MKEAPKEGINAKGTEGLLPEGIESTRCPVISLVQTGRGYATVRVVEGSVKGAKPSQGAPVVGDIWVRGRKPLMLRLVSFNKGFARGKLPILPRALAGIGSEGSQKASEGRGYLVHARFDVEFGSWASSPSAIRCDVMAGRGGSKPGHPFRVGDLFSPEEVDERCSMAREAMVKTGGAMNHSRLGVRGSPKVINVAHGAAVPREEGRAF